MGNSTTNQGANHMEATIKDTPMLRDEYRTIRDSAICLGMSAESFKARCESYMFLRYMERTPANWVIAANSVYASLVLQDWYEPDLLAKYEDIY